ncbi:unnamed protein product [marine sediment metagenome]|uniref:Uncharacterized protein n=1 Tax=marine sediment metagenome TaxID=412755 RepID=X1KG83_9ZZZZ
MVNFETIYKKYDGRYGDLVQSYIDLDKENDRLNKLILKLEKRGD